MAQAKNHPQKRSPVVTLLLNILLVLAILSSPLAVIWVGMRIAFPPPEFTAEELMLAFLADKEDAFLDALPLMTERIYRSDTHEADWARHMNTTPREKTSPPNDPLIQRVFDGTELSSIYQFENQVWCLDFYWEYDYAPLEGSVNLMYIPDDTYAVGGSQYELVSSAENAWHWSGGGIGNSGYVKAERLMPCWFYVEMYVPT